MVGQTVQAAPRPRPWAKRHDDPPARQPQTRRPAGKPGPPRPTCNDTNERLRHPPIPPAFPLSVGPTHRKISVNSPHARHRLLMNVRTGSPRQNRRSPFVQRSRSDFSSALSPASHLKSRSQLPRRNWARPRDRGAGALYVRDVRTSGMSGHPGCLGIRDAWASAVTHKPLQPFEPAHDHAPRSHPIVGGMRQRRLAGAEMEARGHRGGGGRQPLAVIAAATAPAHRIGTQGRRAESHPHRRDRGPCSRTTISLFYSVARLVRRAKVAVAL